VTDPKKPKFGIIESVSAFFHPSIERWRLTKSRETAIPIIRSQINQILLQKRLPQRNADGSMNWANVFASKMELGRPISREEIFPVGTDEMSEEEIMEKAHVFLKEYSTRWNFGASTTAMDPNVLPEVIDSDFRDSAMKINALPFARTGASCSGHASDKSGYSRSNMELILDAKSPQLPQFLNRLKNLCLSHSQKNGVQAFVRSGMGKDEEFGGAYIGLTVSEPKGWKENELPKNTKTPEGYLAELIPNYFTGNGSINEDVNFDDPKIQALEEKAKEYRVQYLRDKNCFNNSDACKKNRDDFWAEVGKIADEFKSAAGMLEYAS
jgi:hypothetical protein